MENINDMKKQQSEIHPGFESYLECMTRALFTGLAAFTLGKVTYWMPCGKAFLFFINGTHTNLQCC
jgi:hypothetical protein